MSPRDAESELSECSVTRAAVAGEGRGAASLGAPAYRPAREGSDGLMNETCDGRSTRLGSEADFLHIWLWV